MSRIVFIRGRIAPGGGEHFFCTPTDKFCPWEITHKRGGTGVADNLIIAKDRLVFAVASYAHHEIFFMGQKDAILNFIRGISASEK